MIKRIKKIWACILAVLLMINLLPALAVRADGQTLEVNVDTEVIKTLFTADEESQDIRNKLDGKVAFNIDSVGEIEFAAFDRFNIQSDSWCAGVSMVFPLYDMSLVQLHQNLQVTFNGVTQPYLGYGGSLNLYSSIPNLLMDTYPDYPEIGAIVEVMEDEGLCYVMVSLVTTHHVGEMYRLYNPNSGEHFYTANPDERRMLIGLGWNDESVGWIAPASSNTPVYRLYNENGGEHHYTTSVAERDMLVSLGWNDEGIGWYSDDAQTVPLYRQYNPNSFANNHNYTTSLGENDWLVSLGWKSEGVAWYGVA